MFLVVSLPGLAACGKSKSSSTTSSSVATSTRPTTTAKIFIVSPTASEVTGPNITLQFRLVGGEVVPAATKPEGGTKGHIHVFVDDQLVSMAFGTTQPLNGLSPGQHSLRAEFVATDHLPFRNRQIAEVLFCVTHC